MFFSLGDSQSTVEVFSESTLTAPTHFSNQDGANSISLGSSLKNGEVLHRRAMDVSTRYKQAESELIEILMQVESEKLFLKRGHSSLFVYVVTELKLSENVAYSLISVARKAKEVPALKASLDSGAITLSNARRLVPVLSKSASEEQNQAWIEKACESSSRQLERELIQHAPQTAVAERASYVGKERVKLQIGLSEAEMLNLRRVQDLLSQSQKKSVSLEQTVHVLTQEFLRRRDPVAKAKRATVRGKRGIQNAPNQPTAEKENHSKPDSHSVVFEISKGEHLKTAAHQKTELTQSRDNLVTLPVGRFQREPIRAQLKHQVNLRDEGRCAHILENGKRCGQARWIEIHHLIPVTEGGLNALENLITLCSAHHKLRHV